MLNAMRCMGEYPPKVSRRVSLFVGRRDLQPPTFRYSPHRLRPGLLPSNESDTNLLLGRILFVWVDLHQHNHMPILFLTNCPLHITSVVIFFLIVLNITIGASARGYKEVWNGSISDLGWYGEESGERSGYGGGVQQYGAQPGVSYTYPNVQSFGGSQPVYQLPGHSVVITNGPNGQSSEYFQCHHLQKT